MAYDSETRGGWELKGWHVAAIFFAFFGTVIAVNLFMATRAVATFPGLEAKNGFVASQSFQERRAAQEALGWNVRAHLSGGMIEIAFTDAAGRPVEVASLDAIIGRPTHVDDDQTPDFAYSRGTFRAPLALAPGNWDARVVAHAPDGTEFRQRVPVTIE